MRVNQQQDPMPQLPDCLLKWRERTHCNCYCFVPAASLVLMMDLRIETLSACPLCGASALFRKFTAPDYETHTGDYGVDECGECGAAFTNPRPIEADLSKLYAQRNTADFPILQAGLATHLRDYTIDRYLVDPLRRLNSNSSNRTLDILDYGCGDGALTRGLVRAARRRGGNYRITATDFHDTAPPALAGIESVRYLPQTRSQVDNARYHAIFVRHVVEHHPRPDCLIRELKSKLNPNGRLFIEVPNRCSVWARVFGRAYFAYYLPRHLFHFAPRNLVDLIAKGGLRCENVTLSHTPVVGQSLGNLFARSISNTGFLGLATYPVQIAVDAMSGTSSTLRASAVADA